MRRRKVSKKKKRGGGKKEIARANASPDIIKEKRRLLGKGGIGNEKKVSFIV